MSCKLKQAEKYFPKIFRRILFLFLFYFLKKNFSKRVMTYLKIFIILFFSKKVYICKKNYQYSYLNPKYNFEPMNPFPQQVSKPPLKVKSSNLHVEEILDNNNLRKISIPNEGKNNLFKCLSFALFMSLKEELLIQTRLISQLKILIQEKRLSLKLSMFENDLMLFKDYCSNSHFHGFDKV